MAALVPRRRWLERGPPPPPPVLRWKIDGKTADSGYPDCAKTPVPLIVQLLRRSFHGAVETVRARQRGGSWQPRQAAKWAALPLFWTHESKSIARSGRDCLRRASPARRSLPAVRRPPRVFVSAQQNQTMAISRFPERRPCELRQREICAIVSMLPSRKQLHQASFFFPPLAAAAADSEQTSPTQIANITAPDDLPTRFPRRRRGSPHFMRAASPPPAPNCAASGGGIV